MKIDKTEAARRQLVTAIKLFFDEGDRVSVCTLVGAAGRVFSDLCRTKKTGCFHDTFKDAAGKNSDEMLAYLFGPINFFKHANRDPDALLVFDDMRNEDLVFSVVLDFLNISGQQPIEVQVFMHGTAGHIVSIYRYPTCVTRLRRCGSTIPMLPY